MFIWALSRPLQCTNGAESVPEKNLEIPFWIRSEQAHLHQKMSAWALVQRTGVCVYEKGVVSVATLWLKASHCAKNFLVFFSSFCQHNWKTFWYVKTSRFCKKEITRRWSGCHCIIVSSDIFERMIYRILFFILGLPEGAGSVMRFTVCAS